MLIVIDESGDSGFKIERGSSPFFVVTYLIFRDNLVAEELALNLKKLKRALKHSEKWEFKFNRCSKKEKVACLKEIAKSKLEVMAIVIDKAKIYSPHLKTNKKDFYTYIVNKMLAYLKSKKDISFKNATIKIDGTMPKDFRMKFDTYIRKMINDPKQRRIAKIKHLDSKKDILIQAADMVSGAIYRSKGNKTDSQKYLPIVHKRIKNIWNFE